MVFIRTHSHGQPQTSITIPEVVYVVDCGKVKETQYDVGAGLSRLVETWITKAAAKQRRGRAGRTRPGKCYKLFTRKQETVMKAFPVPEMLRVPLESLSLQIKVMRENEDVRVRSESLRLRQLSTYYVLALLGQGA